MQYATKEDVDAAAIANAAARAKFIADIKTSARGCDGRESADYSFAYRSTRFHVLFLWGKPARIQHGGWEHVWPDGATAEMVADEADVRIGRPVAGPGPKPDATYNGVPIYGTVRRVAAPAGKKILRVEGVVLSLASEAGNVVDAFGGATGRLWYVGLAHEIEVKRVRAQTSQAVNGGTTFHVELLLDDEVPAAPTSDTYDRVSIGGVEFPQQPTRPVIRAAVAQVIGVEPTRITVAEDRATARVTFFVDANVKDEELLAAEAKARVMMPLGTTASARRSSMGALRAMADVFAEHPAREVVDAALKCPPRDLNQRGYVAALMTLAGERPDRFIYSVFDVAGLVEALRDVERDMHEAHPRVERRPDGTIDSYTRRSGVR